MHFYNRNGNLYPIYPAIKRLYFTFPYVPNVSVAGLAVAEVY